MVAKEILMKIEIFNICLNDQTELNKGEIFSTIILAEPLFHGKPEKTFAGKIEMIGSSSENHPILKINDDTYLFISDAGYGRQGEILYALKAVYKIVCRDVKRRYENLLNSKKRGVYVKMAESIEKDYLSEILSLENP